MFSSKISILNTFRNKRWYSSIGVGGNTNGTLYDVVIVGGGIVGSATARELLNRKPSLKICLVEKEDEIAPHQSSHNSGVIHCGIYYKTGSAKARLCVKGADMMYEYCKENNVPVERCGKLIVATKQSELKSLDALYQRGIDNGVKDLRLIDPHEIKTIEPHIQGIKAIHSPNTGIVDYKQVTKSMIKQVIEKGGHVKYNFEAIEFNHIPSHQSNNIDNNSNNNPLGTIKIKSKDNKCIEAKFMISCAGMYSDRVSQSAYGEKSPEIVPFRGNFLKFKKEYQYLIKGNVYPVPNPAFPFLGVHFTKKINGEVWIGPSAVLAFDREGYHYSDVNFKDLIDIIRNKGFRKMALKHWWFGLTELVRDIFPSAFLEKCKPFMPDITISQIDKEEERSGIRAMAMGDGELIDDFIFDTPLNKPIMHVRNAPSPSATSSLAIAQEIYETACKIPNSNSVLH